MATPMYKDFCKKPGCTNEVELGGAAGNITLNLWRRVYPASASVEIHQANICAKHANDLADWWLEEKR